MTHPVPTRAGSPIGTPRTTLVLMACSATKTLTTKPIEAIELYQGPLWQMLRQQLGAIPRSQVCVLSARYGFINALSRIQSYDARLSREATERLIARRVTSHNDQMGRIKPGRMMGASALAEAAHRDIRYQTVIIAAGRLYARVLDCFAAEFRTHALLAADATIHRTVGGIGHQRQQLATWLAAINARREERQP